METKKKYIFFQDFDDIATTSRFAKQILELEARKLDMLGSHELRIDQFLECLSIIRFPLDVNQAFKWNAYHPIFHPTCVIKRDSYLKAKGFSTDMKFGYDLQFAMRASYLMKIGNIDEFLYIRFKRPGSLTTAPKTKLGTELRAFMWWRWLVDRRLVNEGLKCGV